MLEVKLLNIPFTSFKNLDEFRNLILDFLHRDKLCMIFTPNAEMLALAKDDLDLKKILEETDLNLPDGVGVLLLARRKGVEMSRFPGVEALLEILTFAEELGVPVFFLGAKEEVVNSMVERLKLKFPNLKIAGFHDGYFSESKEEEIIEEINNSGAKILFVALGVPKQEYWVFKNKEKLKVNIAMGVGGSFDVLSGKKKRAPLIFRKLSLEWLYRLMQEPKRLIERFPNLVKFFLIYLFYGEKEL
ncbi:MAG TPA: WecB/TagA/CpsF family glycosyltransferase [Dictyoglomaceae bacterium]|nr:WecB/TagA/CpsF family glycosyltransferase [Dictyoglomaceae bacterium]HOL39637.1 WecB/TagA/CpsF family glycosyltransferase [Dictyoglomaceae bacterium]HOP95141.1 WecB/TagA/CpsF family glycosyltransferase [Dictyoglomaceae bacterium]HPP15209.1 WecB/TagA/CpsF family glycosyltransferase [Dictyoglomaceae bacterium]HPU42615.1 WecB/TagA/CpsF family glycosyltransferase [Dictyoglomaceae bacterium]